MTGNVVFLGFALAGASGLSAISSLLALGAFVLGALCGALLALHVSIAATLAVALALSSGVAAAAHAVSRTDAVWTRA